MDGTKIEAHGIGDIQLKTAEGVICLTNVWHVPNIRANLLSVTRMIDAGYKVQFEKLVCFVAKEGVKATLGYRKGSLY